MDSIVTHRDSVKPFETGALVVVTHRLIVLARAPRKLRSGEEGSGIISPQ